MRGRNLYCEEGHDVQWYRDQNMWLYLPGAVLCVLLMLLTLLIEESPVWKERQDKQALGDGGHTEAGSRQEPTPSRTWILAIMGTIAMQLTGINAVMFYSGKFFDSANYSKKQLGSCLVMAWNFVSAFIAIVLITRVGRRGLMVTGMFMIAVSITLLTPFDEWVRDDGAKAVLCFACLAVYILGFELGPGSLFWVYLPEVAPPSSPMFPVASGLTWVFSIAITFGFPPIQEAIDAYVFWVFAFFAWVTGRVPPPLQAPHVAD
eukprot:gene9524-10763_t